MAETAGEFAAAAADLEDELSCPICLCIYNNPVSLRCGHSFCKDCIKKALVVQKQCPMCKVELGPLVELRTNFQLCSIVEKVLKSPSKGARGKKEDEASPHGEGTPHQEAPIISCDFCLEHSQPAVKTCLNCEASLCQAHLSKHSAQASQKNHILVEPSPGGSMEERKCPQHEKLLECYCQNDLALVCMLCSIASAHKGHKVITLKEAFAKQQVSLNQAVKNMETSKDELNRIFKSLLKSEETVKTNDNKLRDQLSKVFKEIHSLVDQKQEEILGTISSNESEQLSEIHTLKQQAEQKREAAHQILQELKTLKGERDAFLFIKTFKGIQDRLKKQNFKIASRKVAGVVMNQLPPESVQQQTKVFLSKIQSQMKSVHSAPHLGMNPSPFGFSRFEDDPPYNYYEYDDIFH